MWNNKLVSIFLCFAYLCSTQLVVHAFAMHDMSKMHDMDHDNKQIACDCGHDHSTHHMVWDLSIGNSSPTHDSTSCISTTKTAAKPIVIQSIISTVSSPPLQKYIYGIKLPIHVTYTTPSSFQPPGRSEFLDYHYGHGIVMLS